MTLDITRDELTVHRERAFLVSVALPDRPWISSDPLEELQHPLELTHREVDVSAAAGVN